MQLAHSPATAETSKLWFWQTHWRCAFLSAAAVLLLLLAWLVADGLVSLDGDEDVVVWDVVVEVGDDVVVMELVLEVDEVAISVYESGANGKPGIGTGSGLGGLLSPEGGAGNPSSRVQGASRA